MTIASALLFTRFAVIGLETVAAVSAVGGGIGLAAGNAIGMPADWLAATPFSSWLVPGVLLLLVVAVPMGVAAVAELRRSRRRCRCSRVCCRSSGSSRSGW